MTVLQSIDTYGLTDVGPLIEGLREGGRRTLDEAAALAGKHRVKADFRMVESRTARVSDVIIDAAKKWRADIIVMGTHGRRGVTRMLLGSDAEGVLRDAPVPVLLVRAAAARRATRRRR
jgi:nucleotide-binding universal stress UspA family protein